MARNSAKTACCYPPRKPAGSAGRSPHLDCPVDPANPVLRSNYFRRIAFMFFLYASTPGWP